MDAPGRFLYYEVDCQRDGWITQLDNAEIDELMEKDNDWWWELPSTVAGQLSEDPTRESIRIHTQIGLRTGLRRLKLRLLCTSEDTWLYHHEHARVSVIVRYMPAKTVACSVHATWNEAAGSVHCGW